MTIQNNDMELGAEFARYSREARLLEARTIFLSEAVTSKTAKRVIADLFVLDETSDKPIYLFLNSPGGEVTSGFAIFDVIRYINSEVVVVTAGLCASIATVINVAVPKERRFCLPNSKFLIHQPLISGQIQGPASDIEITAVQIIKTRERINQLLADECGQSLIKVEEDTQRDYWMTAPEAIEYGLVGKIIKSKKELK